MEKESIISGYCRMLDASRMVELITADGKLVEVDCCFANCVHTPNCTIAARIREELNP